MDTEFIFPRPHTPDDIIIVDHNGAQSQLELFSLLADLNAEEAPDKSNLSADTRLLISQGWVFKTRHSAKTQDITLLRARVSDSIERTKKLQVWAPEKAWFILHAQDHYWPINVTRQMKLIWNYNRHIKSDRSFKKLAHPKWYIKEIQMFFKTALTHHVLLDFHPRNFGIAEDARSLYYIDDEVYYYPNLRSIIPKSPERKVLR